MFVKDAAGRAPGIYTYLAGPPNNWSKAKVDHNLRTDNDPNSIMGPFDPASVMLYRFAAFFYKTNPSPCTPTGTGQELSDGDRRGLAVLYPDVSDASVLELADKSAAALGVLGAELPGAEVSEYSDRLVELLAEHASVRG